MSGTSEHYQKRYGTWAGNPHGRTPDFARCCKSLYDKYHPGGYQCTRKRGFGPDGAYCRAHDPAVVASRQAASKAKYDKQWQRRQLELAAPSLLAALKAIADGHNDPRALAKEVIAPFDTPPSREGE